jgi:low affinity Fe/Cu permease
VPFAPRESGAVRTVPDTIILIAHGELDNGQPLNDETAHAHQPRTCTQRLTMPAPFSYRINQTIKRLGKVGSHLSGSSWAFLITVTMTLLWLVTGPIFGFSAGWQVVMNIASSLATFLMVFLLERSQEKEAMATQMKLNEIIAALKGASNRLINAETLSEEEVHEMHARYQDLAERVRSSGDAIGATSIEQLPLKRKPTE